MNILAHLEKPETVYKIARRLSERDTLIWYCMEHPKRSSVCVSESDLKRYMQLGFKVVCCYCNGERHKNAFFDRDRGRYIFTEY